MQSKSLIVFFIVIAFFGVIANAQTPNPNQCGNLQYAWKNICLDRCPNGYIADDSTRTCIKSSGNGTNAANTAPLTASITQNSTNATSINKTEVVKPESPVANVTTGTVNTASVNETAEPIVLENDNSAEIILADVVTAAAMGLGDAHDAKDNGLVAQDNNSKRLRRRRL